MLTFPKLCKTYMLLSSLTECEGGPEPRMVKIQNLADVTLNGSRVGTPQPLAVKVYVCFTYLLNVVYLDL